MLESKPGSPDVMWQPFWIMANCDHSIGALTRQKQVSAQPSVEIMRGQNRGPQRTAEMAALQGPEAFTSSLLRNHVTSLAKPLFPLTPLPAVVEETVVQMHKKSIPQNLPILSIHLNDFF